MCVYAALVVQPTEHMRHIILSSVACWLYNISPHYLTNGKIFGGKILIIKCVFLFSLQLLSEIFLVLRIIRTDITNVRRSSCKVPVIFLSDFNETHVVSKDFRKVLKSQLS